MNKNIRSKVVKESLLDYNALANSLKENTESAVKTLLDEAVRDTYAKLLSEGDDKDYEEEEVEDTSSDITDDAESTDAATDGVEDVDTGMDSDEPIDDADVEGGDDTELDATSGDNGSSEDGEEWAEFDKYKISDDEYDFSNAEDEEIVKVYKLMKNDDQILVHKDENGNVNIQDNETGAEYLINLGDDSNATSVSATEPSDDEVITDDEGADEFGAEDDFENDYDDMNESTEKMFELVLEYDSNVGYTDNYQKKDVMTNPGMSEPGKNVNDWDAGVPHGTEKPWSGYPKKKKTADKPFNAGEGKQLENEERLFEMEIDGNAEGSMEECGNVDNIEESNLSQSRWNDTHAAHNRVPAANKDEFRRDGIQKTSKGTKYRANGGGDNVDENFMMRANKVLRENKELKSTLTDVMTSLKEAAVTNHNLGMIIKLISENSTTQDEKKEIISRFSKEAKSVEASKNLYESIGRELKKSNKMNITENKSLSVNGSKKINETKIYQSPDVMESLDLMHRMMK